MVDHKARGFLRDPRNSIIGIFKLICPLVSGMSMSAETTKSTLFSCFRGTIEHDEIKSLFVKVLNIVRPDHPYIDNPYPVSESDIDYGHKKSSSPYYASCGPRRGGLYVAKFAADKSYFNDVTIARILAILTHEVTHVTVGSHSNYEHGSHPPRFFREFGFNAHLVLENWDKLDYIFEGVTKRDFIGSIIKDEVTKSNIDKRYGSVDMRRQEMARWFENTLKD